jgi:hypothetical protein
MRLTGCPETSVTNHERTPRHIPELLRSKLYCGGNHVSYKLDFQGIDTVLHKSCTYFSTLSLPRERERERQRERERERARQTEIPSKIHFWEVRIRIRNRSEHASAHRVYKRVKNTAIILW